MTHRITGKKIKSRLMILDKKSGDVTHRHFYDIKEYLRPGDCLVINNTRVIPARLYGEREETGGKVEILLLKRKSDDVWRHCKTGQKSKDRHTPDLWRWTFKGPGHRYCG